jgi:hypothetical protein
VSARQRTTQLWHVIPTAGIRSSSTVHHRRQGDLDQTAHYARGVATFSSTAREDLRRTTDRHATTTAIIGGAGAVMLSAATLISGLA